TMVSDRYEPWWFFPAVLALGSLPWTIPTVRALLTGWHRSTTGEGFDVRRFLWIWSASVFVFFSASDSKLVPYILPMFPSVALLMATMEETRLRRDLRHMGVLLLIIGATFLTLAVLLPRLVPASPRGELFFDLRPVLFVDAVIALAGGVLA